MKLLADVPSSSSILPQLFLILILTLLNAFFAASELAILSANKNRIQILADNNNKKAKLILKMNANQTNFLSTIQVGITLAGFFSSATAATSLSDDFAQFLTTIGLPYLPEVSMVVITILLSYITLVFGELFPKRIALRFPEKVALFVSPFVNSLTIITKPFVKLLSGSCNILVKLTRLDKHATDEKISEDEIKSVIKTGELDGVLSKDEASYIERVLSFSDLEAHNIMTPRTNCFLLDIETPLKKQLALLTNEKYTRVPVYKKTTDNIIGILNIKDLLFAMQEGKELNLKDLLREPLFVSKYINLAALLKELRQTNNQIAMIIDEYGGFSGLVTLEDVVEELVGNITDEYDENNFIVKTNENTYLVDASISILDLNRLLNLDFELVDDNYNTLGGLIIHELGFIPNENNLETITYKNLTIKIEEIIKNRIIKASIIINHLITIAEES